MSISDAPKCSAKAKRTGKQCGKAAMRGGSVCRSHGGSAPQIRAKAAERVALAEAEKLQAAELARAERLGLIDPAEGDPVRRLLEAVERQAMLVAFWGLKVVEVPEGEAWGPTYHAQGTRTGRDLPHITLRMYEEAVERMARISKVALDAGVDERVIQLAEAHGAMVHGLVSAILDGLALTDEQTAKVPALVHQHLQAISDS